MESSEKTISIWSRMWKSIFTNDGYILIWAVVTLVILGLTIYFAFLVQQEVDVHYKDPNKRFTEFKSECLNIFYNTFTTLITVFPLLGMFGTVRSLIVIDFESMNYQKDFFGALTSTAWGIVFSILFKLINAVLENWILFKIDSAEELIENDRKDIIQNGEE